MKLGTIEGAYDLGMLPKRFWLKLKNIDFWYFYSYSPLFLLRGQARDLVVKNWFLGVVSHEKSIRGTVDM